MLKHIRRWLAGAAIVGTMAAGAVALAPAADAAPARLPPNNAPTCLYTWGAIPGHPESLYVAGISSNGPGCTADVTVHCTSGYWTGRVFLYIPSGNQNYGRNANPCQPGDPINHVFFRELYGFGRSCWQDTSSSLWAAWYWNNQAPASSEPLCTNP